jgi:hypothetical protein
MDGLCSDEIKVQNELMYMKERGRGRGGFSSLQQRMLKTLVIAGVLN